MAFDHSAEELRVLGVLIEKELSTPEYYPLTLNSLTTGCNQKSNREPVVAFTQTQVMTTLDSLMRQRLVGHATGGGSRAEKFRQAASEAWSLEPSESALLAVLMLRGPQTLGQLRARTNRLFAFESLEKIESVLTGLAAREDPLALQFPRQPGQKEVRFAHLLAGEPDLPDPPPRQSGSGAAWERVDALETKIAEIEARLDLFSEEFDRFRSQFE